MSIIEEITNLEQRIAKLKQDFLTQERKEGKVDWGNLPKDTPILVRTESGKWIPRYFASYCSNNTVKCYASGKTSETVMNQQQQNTWEYFKLNLEAPSIINWIPNTTGKRPEGTWIAKAKRGADLITSSSGVSFALDSCNLITHYFLIPKP